MRPSNALVPYKSELVLYGFIALLIAVVGNLEFFARQLGLIDRASDQSVVIVSGQYLQEGLNYIDGFSLSAASAVFVFWSLTGIVALSIIHSVSEVYSEVSQDVSVATKFYHPSNFSTLKFWKNVIVQTILNAGLYVVVLFSVFFVSIVLAPIVITALEDVVSSVSVPGIAVLAGGYLALWAGVTILGVGLRLILLRKHIDV